MEAPFTFLISFLKEMLLLKIKADLFRTLPPTQPWRKTNSVTRRWCESCVKTIPTCRGGGPGNLDPVRQVEPLAVHQLGAEDEFAC